MSRLLPRTLLTDAALALLLVLLTLGPNLTKAMLEPDKLGAAIGWQEKLNMPAEPGWWLLSVLIIAGLMVRQLCPVPALALTAIGAFGHLLLLGKVSPVDLALPLAMYTVASVARNRRTSFALLALCLSLSYASMAAGQIRNDQQAARQKVVEVSAQRVETVEIVKTPPWGPSLSAEQLISAGQAAMELILLLVAAFAVGDAMRSRREHLAAVEQRTADLAREERQRAALAVAAERARITRELHDVVAHGMSVMVVQAQGAAAALDRHPDRTATALQHVIEVGRASLADMRRMLRTDPGQDAQLAPLPGIGSVPALVDQLRSTGMPIELHVDGVPAILPAAVDLSAYRIVQEALTNTLKHAGPGAGAVVRLDFDPERLLVDVADDGAGLAAGADGRGNGLRGIAERVAMLGGALDTGRGDGGGFRIRATLPVGTGP